MADGDDEYERSTLPSDELTTLAVSVAQETKEPPIEFPESGRLWPLYVGSEIHDYGASEYLLEEKEHVLFYHCLAPDGTFHDVSERWRAILLPPPNIRYEDDHQGWSAGHGLSADAMLRFDRSEEVGTSVAGPRRISYRRLSGKRVAALKGDGLRDRLLALRDSRSASDRPHHVRMYSRGERPALSEATS